MKKLIFLPCFCFLMMLQINSHAQIFHEDFEIADSVTYSSNSSAGWGQNSRLYISGSFSDSASIQNPGDIINMTTIAFSTIGMDSVILYFNHIAKLEFFDGGFIEVSNDSGMTWIRLMDDLTINANCTYYGAGLFGWQSNRFQEANYVTWQPGNNIAPEFYWWKREIFDVSILLANTSNAMIRFVLEDQNGNGGSARAGWFIEDIEVGDSLDTYLYGFMNKTTGKMFVDMNSNFVQDSIEPGVPGREIRQLSSPFVGYTGSSGYYEVWSNIIGAANVTPDPTIVTHPYFSLTPVTNSANFTSLGQTDSLNNFALQPVASVNDLSIDIINSYLQHNAYPNCRYWIMASNIGSNILNSTVVFYPDGILTYDTAYPSPSIITPDSIVWNVDTLNPFQRKYISLVMQKPSGLNIGTQIVSSVKIDPISGDIDTSDNFDLNVVTVTGAFDPNYIIVDTPSLTPNEIASSEFLEYTIYFQNIGNDSAHDVRVENLIPVELDMNTFELVANSHDMEIKFDYFVNPRLLSFTYNNIMLPDSTTNEPESHGFVRYRIKPLSNLVIGDSILNNAAIYFDFNPPIVTNTAITEIVDPTSIEEMTIQNNWSVFPNPVNSELNINFELLREENVTIEIFNLYGQKINVLLDEKVVTGLHQHKFNMTSLSNGVYLIQFLNGDSRQVKKFVKVD